MTCGECGLKPWDADDLAPGDDVCVCNDDLDDVADLACPCGGDCWDERPERPIETVDTGGLL